MLSYNSESSINYSQDRASKTVNGQGTSINANANFDQRNKYDYSLFTPKFKVQTLCTMSNSELPVCTKSDYSLIIVFFSVVKGLCCTWKSRDEEDEEDDDDDDADMRNSTQYLNMLSLDVCQ